MDLRPSPLQIEGYYLKELHCGVRAGLDETAKLALAPGLHVQPTKVVTISPFGFDVNLDGGRHKKNPNRFRYDLRIASNADNANDPPYDFEIVIVGYFGFQGPAPDESIVPQITRNATMILYSAAREILAAVTGRGPFPGL